MQTSTAIRVAMAELGNSWRFDSGVRGGKCFGGSGAAGYNAEESLVE